MIAVGDADGGVEGKGGEGKGGEGRGAMFTSRHPISALTNLQNGRPKITEMCIKKKYK